MNISKYKNDGITGLVNLGNTCFLNACIQVLKNTYEICDLIEKKHKNNAEDIDDDSIIIREWIDLSQVMRSGNGIVSPDKFVYNVQRLAKLKNRELFTGWVQNDMPEFLLFLIECMHNSICRPIKMNIKGNPANPRDKIAIKCYQMLKNIYMNEYSEIMHTFYGIYVNTISSIHNEATYSIKPEHYFILDLQILCNEKPIQTIYDCFDLFTMPEFLEGDNAWYNEETKQKENVKKQIRFWNLPNILIITLKRFSIDGSSKINNLIQFPLENLNLSKYIIGYNPDSYVYDLYGICNHMGSVMGGHYTSFVKNADDKWIHYDDTNVEIVENSNDIISNMAYCLFYRKKNSIL
jgi:ubiquitin carboxyl-terminal hydrolase 8